MDYSKIKIDGLVRYQGRLCFVRNVDHDRKWVALVWDEDTVVVAGFDALEGF